MKTPRDKQKHRSWNHIRFNAKRLKTNNLSAFGGCFDAAYNPAEHGTMLRINCKQKSPAWAASIKTHNYKQKRESFDKHRS